MDDVSSAATITGADTLEDVGRQAATFLQLTPINTERFVADWLSEWTERGFTAEATVDEAQASETDGWVWDRLCGLTSQYAHYHTNQQLADFILFNLIRVTNKNVLQALSVLAERSTNEETQRLLLTVIETLEVLDDEKLSERLHELAHPS